MCIRDRAEREGRDGDPSHLERAQELAEPEVRITQKVVVGHPHVVEVELAGIEAAPADAAHFGAHGEARCVLLDDQAGKALTAFDGVGARQECDAERHVRPSVRDEGLAAVDQPPAVAPLGPGADTCLLYTSRCV